ncbi:MAG: hypothetical protein NDI60_01810 [Elusimicrobiales bacterium]|nr:hypothetical protein [Elusimicrobiales bacterium]
MSRLVITAEERLPAFPLLVRAMSAGRKLDADTAAKEARHCWGILGENLDAAAAAALAADCAAFGVRVLEVPAENATPLPAPLRVKKVVFEDGAAVFTGEAAALSCAPQALAVLAAAPIKTESSRLVQTTEGPSSKEKAVRLGIMAVTGLPIGMGKTREIKKEVKSSEMEFYLDLVLDGGATRLRLVSGDLDFSGLKEKKTYSSQVNFRLLCAELAAFAPTAWKNAGLLAILAGTPLTLLPYDSLADLEKETLRLTLARGK